MCDEQLWCDSFLMMPLSRCSIVLAIPNLLPPATYYLQLPPVTPERSGRGHVSQNLKVIKRPPSTYWWLGFSGHSNDCDSWDISMVWFLGHIDGCDSWDISMVWFLGHIDGCDSWDISMSVILWTYRWLWFLGHIDGLILGTYRCLCFLGHIHGCDSWDISMTVTLGTYHELHRDVSNWAKYYNSIQKQ